ncbi:hypothetical protein [Hymenobacter sp. DG01]|uniref:hypothetical protein n=1 Tax=Hymenobacter sp. DG01 TaxID=2584940 RepID=UPI0011228704|nr:hypothetical protein [Hymenobacter sp. DG01]
MKTPMLLPCPFCGGPAAEDNNLHPLTFPKVPAEHFVSCANEGHTCPATVAFVGPCPTLEEATSRWNTRAKPPD